MGFVDVRRFEVATHVSGPGKLDVAGIWLADEDTWDVDLAEVVKVNGLAVPADRKLTYRVIRHELRLLLSFLVDAPGSPLTIRHSDFRASSAHVQRFISESFGLGMLTAAAERHHRWKLGGNGLYNFDVLPAKVAAQYPGAGIRPDLLFDFTEQGQEKRLAGEARGRGSARPVYSASKDQRDRLATIVAWSGANGLHPVTMTYAYTGSVNAQLDLFDINVSGDSEPPDIFPMDMASTQEPTRAVANIRFESWQTIRPLALQRAAEITDQLYETAPEDGPGQARSIYGRIVRGSWATADLIAPSRLRFFLGVLDEPLTSEQTGALRQRRSRTQRDADPIQIAATGRILAVVARDAPQDPSWSEVTSRLQ
jgi:hypothetical protein